MPLSSTRTYPCAEVAPPSFAAFVVILATSTTASINGSVVGMFEMPFVPNVEFAQQGLDHGSLRSESQGSVLLMMAFPPARGNWHMFLDRRTTMISPQSDATVQGCTAVQRSGYVSRLTAGDPDGYTMRWRVASEPFGLPTQLLRLYHGCGTRRLALTSSARVNATSPVNLACLTGTSLRAQLPLAAYLWSNTRWARRLWLLHAPAQPEEDE